MIDYLQAHQIIEQVNTKGAYIRTELNKLYQQFDIIGDIRSIGMLAAIEFVADRQSKRVFPRSAQISAKMKKIAMQTGLVVYPCRGLIKGEKGDAILIAPPLNISDDELKTLIHRLQSAIKQLHDDVLFTAKIA